VPAKDIAAILSAMYPDLQPEAATDITKQYLDAIAKCLQDGLKPNKVTVIGVRPNLEWLASALTAARKQKGMSQNVAAEKLEWSVSKVIRIEGAQTQPSLVDVNSLCQLYGITDAKTVEKMRNIVRRNR